MIDCSTQETQGPLERIRSEFEQSSKGEITVSIGVSSYSDAAPNKNLLIEKAETALLRAKNSGKNRIITSEKTMARSEDEIPTVLIVDDEPKNVKLLKAMLHHEEYHILETLTGEDVFPLVSKHNIDLILLDVMMPGISGFDICSQLKTKEGTRLIPIVLVTALNDSESRIKGIEAGADDFISKPPNRSELLARVKSLIRVKSLNNKLASIENVLYSFAQVIEAKDSYTQGHIERVADLSVAIAEKMGLTGKQIRALRLGGILHDIGKISVPNNILNKPDKLDENEWQIMKKHPDVGYKIAYPLKDNLQSALNVIRHHHEKLDGSGYPDGLRGEEITLEARIMAIVDIYDALITDRAYRKAMSREKAFDILRHEAKAGKLDNEIVNMLIGYIMK
jgi:putative two-component system response regulator